MSSLKKTIYLMKRIFSILLLTLTLSASAQWYKSEAFKSVAINTSIILLETVGDGLIDQGRYEGNQNKMVVGHAVQASSVALCLTKPLLQDLDRHEWVADIISYSFIRIGTFNMAYNVTRELPIGYTGTTSLYDRVWNSFRAPESWVIGGQMLCLTVGISIPIDILKP
jgi:hypothetical protein